MNVQYIPPEETPPPSSGGPARDRTLLWVGIAAAVVFVVALAVIIPLALRGGDGESSATTSTETVSTLVSTTTTEAPTTTTTLAGPVGDSSGAWVEIAVPGGPWGALEVAVSDDALLIVSQTATGYQLSAIMLGSGDIVAISESEALFGVDLDGSLAVWWEASGWDPGTETYANQYIKSCLLPSGAKNTLASGGAARLGLPQVAFPWVAWVQSAPSADDPEYWTERIMATRVDSDGAAVGSTVTMVSSALAFALGDSSWQYSLSSTRVSWETHAAIDGYELGTHVMRTDLSGHDWTGAEAWRPSLWDDLLVYQDGSLRVDDLSSGDMQVIDPSGDFATAGPTFAAFYKPSSTGSYLVVRGYAGRHEQTLDDLGQPPYFCPPISVSDNYVAYAFDYQVHVFKWQAQ